MSSEGVDDERKHATGRSERRCTFCGSSRRLVPAQIVRPKVTEEIRREHPEWSGEGFICQEDLARFRTAQVQRILEGERDELTRLERDVIESMSQQELVAENVEQEFDQELSFGERLSDRIAEFGGSWKFLIIFAAILVGWMTVNTALLLFGRFDPYPFILLNLVLSCLAAIQAPVIMMSQNRQEAKDRKRAANDYRVNLKAELEIRHLHEKVDHLLLQQWERLFEVQQIQLELLDQLAASSALPRSRRKERDEATDEPAFGSS